MNLFVRNYSFLQLCRNRLPLAIFSTQLKLLLTGGLFLFLPIFCVAQGDKAVSTIWGLKSHYGYIIPHSQELEEVANTNPWGIQAEWSKLNLTQRAWNQCNCYSKIGLSFSYFNYENPEVLGNSYNLILFGEPYITFNKQLLFTFRTGIGATYLDQVYDEERNPKNTFYSSPISFILLLNIAANYQLSPEWQVNLTAHYNHISNGGIKHPNRGMNFPTISLGIDHTIDAMAFPEREKIEAEKFVLQGYGRFFVTRKTVKANEDFPEENEWLLGIAGGAKMMVANFNAISAGVEIFKDNTLSVEAHRRAIREDHPYVIGLAVGHHFVFGRFNFSQQMLYYAYKPFPFTEKRFYQRYELAYQLSDLLLAGVSLKAHGHVADNFDVRLGITF